jgi:Domain of unknown function (DUF4202)
MSAPLNPAGPDRFAAACRRFDDANAQDPNVEVEQGEARPRELVYAGWLTGWVLKLCPGASEELRLAARAQHLCRWMIPRDTYPMTRVGYLKWRQALKEFHAGRAGEILRETGYSDTVTRRVQSLIRKQDFPHDPEACVLEDALCLVFLEHQLAALAARNPADKVIGALRKSWAKMTASGRAEALKLRFGPKEKALVELALKSA